jgi:hypothetical protein
VVQSQRHLTLHRSEENRLSYGWKGALQTPGNEMCSAVYLPMRQMPAIEPVLDAHNKTVAVPRCYSHFTVGQASGLPLGQAGGLSLEFGHSLALDMGAKECFTSNSETEGGRKPTRQVGG